MEPATWNSKATQYHFTGVEPPGLPLHWLPLFHDLSEDMWREKQRKWRGDKGMGAHERKDKTKDEEKEEQNLCHKYGVHDTSLSGWGYCHCGRVVSTSYGVLVHRSQPSPWPWERLVLHFCFYVFFSIFFRQPFWHRFWPVKKAVHQFETWPILAIYHGICTCTVDSGIHSVSSSAQWGCAVWSNVPWLPGLLPLPVGPSLAWLRCKVRFTGRNSAPSNWTAGKPWGSLAIKKTVH